MHKKSRSGIAPRGFHIRLPFFRFRRHTPIDESRKGFLPRERKGAFKLAGVAGASILCTVSVFRRTRFLLLGTKRTRVPRATSLG
jgi:hypothetical protein